MLDEAQRIKNWATKTALSVKGLNPPYRLVLTGTPMENRIDELASIVEWVDDMALEPKWRLPALHAMRADGRREVIGVRNLDTIRERLQPCMVRRIRQEVLDQLPPRTDTRVPIEMTAAQIEEHDALIQPIAALMRIAEVRPLTQAEFLRLMSLLTTQRIISNGLAQLQFEDVWPTIRGCAPDESVLKGLSAPKLLELRQLVRQIVLDQGRKVVIFSQWRRMLHLAHWAVGDILAERSLRAGFFTGAERQRRRTQNIVEFHDDPEFSHPLRQRCRRRRAEPAARRQLRDQPRAALEPGRARAADRPHLPPGPEAADRRLQPRLRAGNRVADRRPRGQQAGVLQGPLRRRQRHGEVRPVRVVPLPGQEALRPRHSGRGRGRGRNRRDRT